MKLAALAGTVLLLGTATTAQIVVPKGLDKTEGANYSYGVGQYANARHQIAEGSLTTATVIKRMRFRLDGTRTYYTSSGMGRKWTNVTIGASDVNTASMGSNFKNNVTGTVTQVFNAAYSWPSFTSGKSKTSPAAWDNNYSFLFTKVKLASGKNSILWDMRFSGGTLANGRTWGTGWYSYYFDGKSETTSSANSSGTPTYYPARNSTTCNDSGVSLSLGALATAETKVYNNIAPPGLKNMTEVKAESLATAIDAPVIHALGLGGSSTGLNAGALCNKLHVDMTQFHVIIPTRTLKNIVTGYASSTIKVPNNKFFTGAPIWFQAAWSDSKSARFSLSISSFHKVPSIPVDVTDRVHVFTNNPSNATGNFYRFPTAWYYFPVIKYDTK